MKFLLAAFAEKKGKTKSSYAKDDFVRPFRGRNIFYRADINV